ncbi:MAG: hypothetical protein ABWY25_01485 [Paenisporosarcina sp.]
MQVYLLMKHYEHDDRPFMLAIYTTRELAEKAMAKALEVNPDQEDDFECWIWDEPLLDSIPESE